MSVYPATKPSAAVSWLTTHRRSIIAWTALYLGALAVLATGVDHIQQYYANDYSSVPTIGTLFFLNFVGAVVLAGGLIAPLRRVAGRYADAIRAAFAVGGIGLAVLSLVSLFISEGSGLFGFVENGYRPAIVKPRCSVGISITLESIATSSASTLWRRATALSALSKQAAYPIAKSCSGLAPPPSPPISVGARRSTSSAPSDVRPWPWARPPVTCASAV